MATILMKKVRRQLLVTIDYGKHRGKSVYASLLPGDILEFQIKGTQQRFECSLHSCFQLAKLMTWEDNFKKKLKEYNEKKKYNSKLRRPKRIQPPFHKMIYKAAS